MNSSVMSHDSILSGKLLIAMLTSKAERNLFNFVVKFSPDDLHSLNQVIALAFAILLLMMLVEVVKILKFFLANDTSNVIEQLHV